MFNQISYNVIIERFKIFAEGHYLIRRFSHGQVDVTDLEKEQEFPWMHVVPVDVRADQGARVFSFDVIFADIPRDKETNTDYQKENISDCIRLAEDLLAEIANGLIVFGPDVELEAGSTITPFIQEYTHTLSGATLALTISVPNNYDACAIPADWSIGGSGSGQPPLPAVSLVLKVNNVDNVNQNVLDLVDGTNVTIEDLGDGRVRINSSGGIASVAWGDITGTLSNQTDLQTALNLKADISSLGAAAFSNDYNDLDNLPTIPTVLNDLTDVDTAGQAFKKVLYYDGAQWVPYMLASVAYSGSYNDLSNKPAIPKTISDLVGNGVNIDDIIVWNGTTWIVQAMPAPKLALDDLDDVNASAPMQGDVLFYDDSAGEWINSQLAVVAYSGDYNDLKNKPTGLPPSGAAGGDLSGTYPDPTVSRIHGIDMQSGTPTAGDVWLYEGSPAKWQHQKLPAIHVTNDSAVTGSTVKDALNHLDSTKQATLVSGTNIKTVNSQSLVGSGNVTVGSVTSVSGTGTTAGLSLSGSVTGSGNLTLSGTLSTPASTINDSTTVGRNLLTLANPSAVRYLRINADNTVSALTLAQLKTDLSLASDIILVVSTNQTNVGTTFEDVTDLSFAVTANKTYKWRATISFGIPTGSFLFSSNGPATSINNARFTITTGLTTNGVSNQTTYDSGTNVTGSSNGLATADGIVRVTASGTWSIRFRASIAGNLTIRAGSVLEYSEVL